MAKGNCEFSGSGGQYFFTVFIHLFILGTITLGVYTPWAWVRIFTLKAAHTRMRGRPVSFTGSGGQLLGLALTQGFLTFLTFGVYGPWAICKFFSWKAQNTLVGDRPSRFNGTGGSLFVFYLVHLMILPLLTLGLYYFWGLYRLYAWKEEHTEYGGEQTSFGAGFGGFLKVSVITWILNGLTLNLFLPWALCMLYKWQVEGLVVGEGHSVEHFPPVKTNLAYAAALVVIGLLPVLAMGFFVKSQHAKFSQAVKFARMMQMDSAAAKKGGAILAHAGPSRTAGTPAPATTKKQPLPSGSMGSGKNTGSASKPGRHAANPREQSLHSWASGSQKDLKQAEHHFTQAIERNPSDSSAFYNRGLVHAMMKEYESAVRDFTKALTLKPGFAEAYCNRGNVYQEMGKPRLAIADYTEALKHSPDDGDLFYNRGLARRAAGQKPQAHRDLKKALQLGQEKARDHLQAEAPKQVDTTRPPMVAEATPPPRTATGRDIFRMVYKGDAQGVKTLLEANPLLVHVTDKERDTPLHRAAFWGRFDIAQQLLDKGAKVNQPGRLNNTPLHNAAFMGRPRLVQLLLDSGARADAKGNVGGTPLHSAAGGRENPKKLEVVKTLISAGIDLNARDNLGGTPVHTAVLFGNPETVQLLVQKGARLDIKDRFGKTPLAKAEESHKTRVVEILKGHGAKG